MEVLKKENILVIQTAFLGDAILTLPMIQELKKKNLESSITVLCIPSTQEVFINCQSVNHVIVFDKRKNDRSFLRFVKLVRIIRSEKFDKVYSPHRSLRSTLISFFSGSKYSVSFNTSSFAFLYKEIKRYDSTVHEVARNLSLINFNCNNDNWKIKPELSLSSVNEKKIELFLKDYPNKKYVAIAPGSVWKTKIYPKEYFIDIIRELTKKDYLIFLIGGNEDKKICEEIASQFDSNVLSVAGKFSVLESIALLKKSEVIICNDSAPTHLAMIADIPVLTIYCSTIPDFGFYPYNSKSIYVSLSGIPCKPCGIHGHNKCPIKTFECGNNLFPSMVISKLKEIIPV